MIDIGLFANNKAVVHCKTVEESKRLFNEIWDYYPEYIVSMRDDYATSSWQLYKQDTCYWPVKHDSGICRLEYCSYQFFKDEGCKILSLDEVILDLQDYGELSPGQIDVLFGGL